jgi:hypothetical protein
MPHPLTIIGDRIMMMAGNTNQKSRLSPRAADCADTFAASIGDKQLRLRIFSRK